MKPIMIGGWDFTRTLTLAEVTTSLGVSVATVDRATRAGRLVCTRTLGGHRRFSAQQIEHIIAGGGFPAVDAGATR